LSKITIISTISQIDAAQWNTLADGHPFLRHEFLLALEKGESVGDCFGWLPRYFLYQDVNNELLGAIPGYIKLNSYGELVFDWAWAEAYQRMGMRYYPKLVVAVPYTPATGKRILFHPDVSLEQVAPALIQALLDYAQHESLSGVHCLFPTESELAVWQQQGFMPRLGCQYHWQNNAYTDFDDYLAHFNNRKRKMVRQERRRVVEAGLDIRWYRGDQASEQEWDIMFDFYRNTFDEKGGMATLTRPFFQQLSRTMGEQIYFVLAWSAQKPVAGALFFCSDDTLYGRYWGCCEHYHSLHFELCYYQGLEFAIRQGLQRFEPGAQGEHKISRGFLPQATWSAHWLRESALQAPVEDFLHREKVAMRQYMAQLEKSSPFKKTD